MIDGNELIKAVKTCYEKFADENKKAAKKWPEYREEFIAETTGANVMMHEFIALIKERMLS